MALSISFECYYTEVKVSFYCVVMLICPYAEFHLAECFCTEYRYAKCHFAVCCYAEVLLLRVIMLCVGMLNIDILSVIMLNVIMPRVT